MATTRPTRHDKRITTRRTETCPCRRPVMIFSFLPLAAFPGIDSSTTKKGAFRLMLTRPRRLEAGWPTTTMIAVPLRCLSSLVVRFCRKAKQRSFRHMESAIESDKVRVCDNHVRRHFGEILVCQLDTI